MPTAAAVIGLVYTLLCLAGFGASLAIEDVLGVNHNALFDGAFDLASLSAYPIVTWTASWALIGDRLLAATVALMGMACSSALLLLLVARVSLLSLTPWKSPSYVRRCTANLGGWFRLPAKNRGFVKPLTLLAGFFMTVPAFFLLSFGLATSVIVLVILVPVAGFNGMKTYLADYVGTPPQCAAIYNGHPLAPSFGPTLPCVVAFKDDTVVAEGLMIVANGSSVVLLTPERGAQALPSRELVIRVVEKLEPQSLPRPSR